MGTDTQLRAMIEAGGQALLTNLARRSNTTAKRLGQLAVWQMLVAARGGAMPAMPPSEPAEGCDRITLWLQPADRTALDQLAEQQQSTPQALAALAVRHMLAQTAKGVLPMLPPPKFAPEPDAVPASHYGGTANFIKARLVIDRLHLMAEWGPSARSFAALKEAEALYQAQPD